MRGNHLEAVDTVRFVPADGINVGAPSVASDGNALTVDIDIAADAPRTLRQVQLTAGGTRIPTAASGSDRFQITAVQPVIRAISPIHVIPGSGLINLAVYGRHFEQVTGVRAIPRDDISFGQPSISHDGEGLTVPLEVMPSASPGARTIVVSTLSGETTTIPAPANTLHIVAGPLQQITPINAPLLGIEKTLPDTARSMPLVLTAPLVGVVREFTPLPKSETFSIWSAPLGVAVGGIATGLSVDAIVVNTDAALTVYGEGLAALRSIMVYPDDGITPGALQTNADGQSVMVPISVDPDAPQTLRALELRTDTGRIPFAVPSEGRLKIAAPPASISAIEPIQEVIGSRFTLVIRGDNLKDVLNVQMIPDSGITIGVVEMTADGESLRVPVYISTGAEGGPRLVKVTTVAGQTGDTMDEANTFTVLTE